MYDEGKKVVVSADEDFDVSQNAYFAYLDEIAQYKLLSADEEARLFQKILNGDNVAKDLFVKSNLRLVIKVAKKYFCPGYNSLLDLIQEGNLGLLKAVDGYDPEKGCKFSTYAIPHINKAIQRSSCRTGLPLEIPPQKISLVNKIRFFIDRFEIENGEKPCYEDIAERFNVPTKAVIEVMPYISSAISLHSKIKEGDDERELLDVFEAHYDNEPTSVENEFIAKEIKSEIRAVMKEVLNGKEIYIVCSRWGLGNAVVKEVVTLAEELGMSKQGVRQCEERALEKLKKHLLALNMSLSDFI